jgi:hypothetical protein
MAITFDERATGYAMPGQLIDVGGHKLHIISSV